MSDFKVVEIFTSINGESAKAGQLAVFVRLQGCNLNCGYCDTRWANEADAPYMLMSTSDIVEAVLNTGIDNVTLTGGEPLWGVGRHELVEALCQSGVNVEIETNGSISLDDFIDIVPRPAFTLDYKLPSSGMEKAMDTGNYECLTSKDTVKFVIGDYNDLLRAQEIIEAYELVTKCHVYFSPVFGQISPEEIIEFMKENRLNGVNFQLQLHKFVWPPQQRGV